MLIGGLTAPGQAELGCSGLIWALLDWRLPLGRGERGPTRVANAPNPRQGDATARQRQPRLIGVRGPLGGPSKVG